MEKLVKVGTMPGRLVEVAVNSEMTVRQAFEIAGVEILSGYEIKADSTKVELDAKIGNTNLILQSKMIKGNNDMIKIGTMPGRLVEVALTGDETVRQAFEIAGIEILSGYEVKADSRTIGLDDKVRGAKLLLQSKMIKGNSGTIKVGTMPGRLVEVAVEGNETVRQVFEIAGIELLSGYEIKADSTKVDLDVKIGNTKLLLQSKMIKGNTRTVKVGTMPGRLVEIAVNGDETVKQVFEIAGVDILSGYEIKADSSKVDLDTKIGSTNLLLQSKMIKGNK